MEEYLSRKTYKPNLLKTKKCPRCIKKISESLYKTQIVSLETVPEYEIIDKKSSRKRLLKNREINSENPFPQFTYKSQYQEIPNTSTYNNRVLNSVKIIPNINRNQTFLKYYHSHQHASMSKKVAENDIKTEFNNCDRLKLAHKASYNRSQKYSYTNHEIEFHYKFCMDGLHDGNTIDLCEKYIQLNIVGKIDSSMAPRYYAADYDDLALTILDKIHTKGLDFKPNFEIRDEYKRILRLENLFLEFGLREPSISHNHKNHKSDKHYSENKEKNLGEYYKYLKYLI